MNVNSQLAVFSETGNLDGLIEQEITLDSDFFSKEKFLILKVCLKTIRIDGLMVLVTHVSGITISLM